MAERRVLTEDAAMVSMAELSDAARHPEMVSHGCELVGVEQTVVCGLDTDSRNEPIGFAARLARRLGWRLSLVPLPEAGAEDERLGRLLAAAAPDRAGFVVTEAVRSGSGAAALEATQATPGAGVSGRRRTARQFAAIDARPLALSIFVWVLIGMALWHFSVLVPDRFWGGIIGAFGAAVAGQAP